MVPMVAAVSLALEQSIMRKYAALRPDLDERSRRLWGAAEAREIGYGGATIVHRATGMDYKTIDHGMRDLSEQEASPRMPGEPRHIRRKGGGRKKMRSQDLTFLPDLDTLVEPTVRGDPMRGLRWTCKSTRKLARELCTKGHKVSHMTVAEELKAQKYSLQGNRKTQEGSSNPDRNAQFLHIHETATTFQKRGDPVISIDTKKKELIGNYKNGGKEWAPEGTPKDVKCHDFIDKKLGKAIPYGIYDIAKNKGFVSVGIDKDTAEFAVQTIRRWWNGVGREAYPKSTELYITADGGGSNASRSRLFKLELQMFADETGLTITVSHYPPGTSKWNKIEHRMFCHITANWRAVPLVSREVIIELIAHTTTEKGLAIHAELDTNMYMKGRVVTKQEFAALALTRKEFHGEWNYTLSPRKQRG